MIDGNNDLYFSESIIGSHTTVGAAGAAETAAIWEAFHGDGYSEHDTVGAVAAVGNTSIWEVFNEDGSNEYITIGLDLPTPPVVEPPVVVTGGGGGLNRFYYEQKRKRLQIERVNNELMLIVTAISKTIH